MEENILEPLGMSRSSFVLTPELEAGISANYQYRKGSLRRVPLDYFNVSPAGSLMATATDMARFMIAHLQNGRYGSTRILDEATARDMHRQHFTHHPELPGVAYGFFERFENGRRAIFHGGDTRAFSSLLLLLPDENWGFFVSCNSAGGAVLRERLADRLLDRYSPAPRQAISPEAPAGSEDRARRFADSYRSTRYPRHTLDKLITLFGQVPITANDDGTLNLPRPVPGEKPDRWVEVGPMLFQRVGGSERIAFREDADGRVAKMFYGAWVLEKLPWYETTVAQIGFIAFFMLAFLSGSIVWPIGSLIRRLRRPRPGALRAIGPAWWLAGSVSLLNLTFLVGLALAMLRIPQWEFTLRVPSIVVALLFLPLVAAVLTVGLPVFAALARKDKRWSSVGRLHYSFITLAALAFIPFLLYWNLLGFRY